jgi:hypothetical protein
MRASGASIRRFLPIDVILPAVAGQDFRRLWPPALGRYGREVFRIVGRGRAARWLLAMAVGMGLMSGFASVAQAHVNRQVGAYTILVILVEEPTFEDNHAGFQFWVRRDGQPIIGLERSVRAAATGHGQTDVLAVPPIAGSGFYVLDQTEAGLAFDPLGGGAWTLHLWGDINGTPLDEQFAVTFPGYPRLGGAKGTAQGNPPAVAASPWLALPLVVLIGIAMVVAPVAAFAFAPRKLRLRPVPPTPEQPR